MEIFTIPNIIAVVLIITNVVVYTIQARKINSIKGISTIQSNLIGDIERYNKMLNPDEFEKILKLKLDKQRAEIESEYNKNVNRAASDVANKAIAMFESHHQDVLKSIAELSAAAMGTAIAQFPTMRDKEARDRYFKEKYPQSARDLIEYADHLLISNSNTAIHSQ